MAEEEEFENPDAALPGEEAPPPADDVPAAGGDLPVMPDALGGTGTGGGGSGSKTFSIKWWVLLIALLLVLSAFFGFYRFGFTLGYRSVFTANLKGMQPKTHLTDAVYPLLNIQANLSDDQIPKFVNLSMHLALNNNGGLQECAMREAELRDVLITLLTRKKSFDIDSATEQRKLKRLMKDELNVSLEGARVKEVYFSQFMIGYRVYVHLDEEAGFLNAQVKLNQPETS